MECGAFVFLRAVSLEHSAWIVVLTTVAPEVPDEPEVLEWYRVRRQIELASQRLKSVGEVGNQPKCDPASSRAWVHAKLAWPPGREAATPRCPEAPLEL